VQAGGGGGPRSGGAASVTITGRGDIELATTGKIILKGTDIELAGQAS
jgi:hypothetical protein